MVASTTAWLNGIGQKIQIAGVLKGPTTNLWNIVAGATAVFNVATGAMDITITGGGGGGGGTGDVVGPASSADDRVALFSGTTGKLLKQSSFAISGILKANGSTPLTADWSLGGFSLTNVKSITYGSAPFDNGNSGTADTINWQAGDIQKSTLTGNVTYTFTAPFGVGGLTLEIIQDPTGGRTISWPATVDWVAGVAPTIAPAANAVTVVTFYWNGSRYRGCASGGGGVSVHSALSGLSADDHTQYSLVTGTRAFTGGITITQAAVSGPGQKAFLVTGGAHTALTAATEAIDVDFALNRTVQWATGGITKQRAAVFRAPTWGFVGASVVADAATLTITGAPVAGANATFTRSYALWIESGASRFDGNISFGKALTAPKLYQEDDATNGVTAQPLFVGGQNATGTGATVGGYVVIAGGTGATPGTVYLRSGTVDCLYASSSSSSVVVNFGGSAAQKTFIQFVATGASALPYVVQAGSTSQATGRPLVISGQNAVTTGGAVVMTTGDGPTPGRLSLMLGGFVNGTSTGSQMVMFEAVQLAANRRITSLNYTGAGVTGVTTTEMPANTGDLVTFIGNAAVAPSANPVGGGILYCDAGALKYRGTSGTVTTVAPA